MGVMAVVAVSGRRLVWGHRMAIRFYRFVLTIVGVLLAVAAAGFLVREESQQIVTDLNIRKAVAFLVLGVAYSCFSYAVDGKLLFAFSHKRGIAVDETHESIQGPSDRSAEKLIRALSLGAHAALYSVALFYFWRWALL